MKKDIGKDMLPRFLKGNYSFNDHVRIRDWLNDPHGQQAVHDELFHLMKETDTSETGSLDYLFQRIKRQINKSWPARRLPLFYWKAAVMVLAVLLASTVFYFTASRDLPAGQSWVSLSVPEGGRLEFILPDSTRGWLNGGASLRYPAIFAHSREVELEGEAFFHVSRHLQRNFIVHAAGLNVKVTGTMFNISAYESDKLTEVVLNEGEVELTGKEGLTRKMVPGEKVSYERLSGNMEVSKVDASQYNAWKDGYLVIDNVPLAAALKKIERWYHADIEIADESVMEYRLRGTFHEEPLEEVLRLVAMIAPIRYELVKREPDQQGKVNKRKVIIMKR
ncbi:MAG: FecR domain-containing protein [Prolixibacteraceae bacterium]